MDSEQSKTVGEGTSKEFFKDFKEGFRDIVRFKPTQSLEEAAAVLSPTAQVNVPKSKPARRRRRVVDVGSLEEAGAVSSDPLDLSANEVRDGSHYVDHNASKKSTSAEDTAVIVRKIGNEDVEVALHQHLPNVAHEEPAPIEGIGEFFGGDADVLEEVAVIPESAPIASKPISGDVRRQSPPLKRPELSAETSGFLKDLKLGFKELIADSVIPIQSPSASEAITPESVAQPALVSPPQTHEPIAQDTANGLEQEATIAEVAKSKLRKFALAWGSDTKLTPATAADAGSASLQEHTMAAEQAGVRKVSMDVVMNSRPAFSPRDKEQIVEELHPVPVTSKVHQAVQTVLPAVRDAIVGTEEQPLPSSAPLSNIAIHASAQEEVCSHDPYSQTLTSVSDLTARFHEVYIDVALSQLASLNSPPPTLSETAMPWSLSDIVFSFSATSPVDTQPGLPSRHIHAHRYVLAASLGGSWEKICLPHASPANTRWIDERSMISTAPECLICKTVRSSTLSSPDRVLLVELGSSVSVSALRLLFGYYYRGLSWVREQEHLRAQTLADVSQLPKWLLPSPLMGALDGLSASLSSDERHHIGTTNAESPSAVTASEVVVDAAVEVEPTESRCDQLWTDLTHSSNPEAILERYGTRTPIGDTTLDQLPISWRVCEVGQLPPSIERGAPKEILQACVPTLMHRAALAGQALILSVLIGPSWVASPDFGETDLIRHTPAAAGSSPLAQALSQIQGDDNQDSANSRSLDPTPLFLAILGGHFEVSENLLRAGASPKIQFEFSSAPSRESIGEKHGIAPSLWSLPLGVALWSGREDLCALLIQYGARPWDQWVHTLAAAGRYSGVRYLVQSLNIHPDTRDEHGCAALHCAVQAIQRSVMACLLDCEAEPNARDQAARTPLHYGVLVCSGQSNALPHAASGARVDQILPMISHLLTHGARGDAVDNEGCTPLLYALHLYDTPFTIASRLIQHGAVVDHPVASESARGPPMWCTLLSWATQQGKMEVVEFLLRHGANIHGRISKTVWPPSSEHDFVPQCCPVDRISSETPLYRAIAALNMGMAKLLLEAGADPAIPNTVSTLTHGHTIGENMEQVSAVDRPIGACGDSPEWLALSMLQDQKVRRTVEPFVRLLQDSDSSFYRPRPELFPLSPSLRRSKSSLDADPTLSLGRSGTLLFKACCLGRADIASWVLNRGCSPNVNVSLSGRTPLHAAAAAGRVACVEVLLDSGADPFIADHQGHTPLESAILAGQVDVLHKILPIARMVAESRYSSSLVGPPMLWTALRLLGKPVGSSSMDQFCEDGTDMSLPTPKEDIFGDADPQQRSALHMADMLLASGVTLNGPATDDMGGTLLHQAAREAFEEAVVFLLSRGADVDIRCDATHVNLAAPAPSDAGSLPRELDSSVPAVLDHIATESGETIEIPQVNRVGLQEIRRTRTVVQRSTQQEPQVSPASRILEASDPSKLAYLDLDVAPASLTGVSNTGGEAHSPNSVDSAPKWKRDLAGRPCYYADGQTPLHAAVWGGSPEVILRLLRAGCDPRAQDRLGRTPELLATLLGRILVAQTLALAHIAESGASRDCVLDLPDCDGRRPLETTLSSYHLLCPADGCSFDGKVDNLLQERTTDSRETTDSSKTAAAYLRLATVLAQHTAPSVQCGGIDASRSLSRVAMGCGAFLCNADSGFRQVGLHGIRALHFGNSHVPLTLVHHLPPSLRFCKAGDSNVLVVPSSLYAGPQCCGESTCVRHVDGLRQEDGISDVSPEKLVVSEKQAIDPYDLIYRSHHILAQGTMLHRAARFCHSEVLHVLLNTCRLDPKQLDASGQSPLHVSCWSPVPLVGRLQMVRALLSTGRADVRQRDVRHGGSSLHFLVSSLAVLYGLHMQHDLDSQNHMPITTYDSPTTGPRPSAVDQAIQLLDVLADAQCDIGARDRVGRTSLQIALWAMAAVASYHHFGVRAGQSLAMTVGAEWVAARPVVTSRVRRTVGSEAGSTHSQNVTAAQVSHPAGDTQSLSDVADRLLAHGADISCPGVSRTMIEAAGDEKDSEETGEGYTLLHAAAQDGQEDVIRYLLAHGARDGLEPPTPGQSRRTGSVTNGPSVARDSTPLHLACAMGHARAVEVLVSEAKVYLEPCDARGRTPLHAAVTQADVVKILLEAGLERNPVDDDGATPLLRACQMGPDSLETVRVLVDRNADPFIPNKHGQTPLHALAQCGGSVRAARLIMVRADVRKLLDAVDDSGRTPLHIAASAGHQGLCTTFVMAGAAVNVPDKLGQTPLDTVPRAPETVQTASMPSPAAIHLARPTTVAAPLQPVRPDEMLRSATLTEQPRGMRRVGSSGRMRSVSQPDTAPDLTTESSDLDIGSSGTQHSALRPSPSDSSQLSGVSMTAAESASAGTASTLPAPRLQLDILRSIAVEPRWLDDALAAECQNCKLKFRVNRRRHHCRHCGRVVCGKCSPYDHEIPKFGLHQPVRVCQPCLLVLSLANDGPPTVRTRAEAKSPDVVTSLSTDGLQATQPTLQKEND